ncbi:MAG: hypothetical protein V1872_08820 [bacterium]
MKKNDVNSLKKILQKNNLSNEDIASILSNTIEENGTLVNIELFNEWIISQWKYHSNYHTPVTLENIELRNVKLIEIDSVMTHE